MDDCISRQAVIDYIRRILNQGTGKKKSFEFIQKYVENLPSVTPKEKNLDKRLESLKSEYNAYHFDDDYWRGVKHAIDILEVRE